MYYNNVILACFILVMHVSFDLYRQCLSIHESGGLLGTWSGEGLDDLSRNTIPTAAPCP